MSDIVNINETTWRIEDGFVRFFVLKGTDKAILLDSGVGSPDAREIAERLTGLPVMLLNTHGDGDHASGTGAFEEIHIVRADYDNCKIGERFPSVKPIDVADGQIIDLGGRPLEIITIPGHTKGSIAILDINNRMLFAGDSVQTGFIYMFGQHRDTSSFTGSLEKLISRADSYDTVVASHGEPLLPAEYVSKVLNAWSEVTDGKINGEIIDLYGNKVTAYKTESCGFYC